MFANINSLEIKPREDGMFDVVVSGQTGVRGVHDLLAIANVKAAEAAETGNSVDTVTTGRRRGSSAAVTDAAGSTSAPETGTAAADAAPATGRRRRGSAEAAPAEAPAAETTTRRRRSTPAPEPEAPKIDTSNQGVTLAATTAVKMIGNPADVIALVKEFDDAKGQPCENVSDIPQDMREELLRDLNKLVVAKTGKPIPGIG